MVAVIELSNSDCGRTSSLYVRKSDLPRGETQQCISPPENLEFGKRWLVIGAKNGLPQRGGLPRAEDEHGAYLCGRDSNSVGHSYQLRQRVRTQLSHELTAMDLNRGFAGSNFGGYLLVGKAGNNQWQHFSLTRCKPFEALPQGGNFYLALASGAM
jgi:hypothetical protein